MHCFFKKKSERLDTLKRIKQKIATIYWPSILGNKTFMFVAKPLRESALLEKEIKELDNFYW